MYYSKCHGELPFLAFSGFRPTATRLRFCFCYSWLKASTVLPKEALISLSANSSTAALKRLSTWILRCKAAVGRGHRSRKINCLVA